ncbi:MAG: hypothetical protein DLM50_08070 [Candidatus Meridianibacter frigidus]|nr:MAG: hypothetical protein DLM50_08070 [Candidatus Eremiobacteraeota bacterium]
MHAVITAGGRVSGEFARVIGTDVKALALIGGRTLLDCAIDAARGAGVRSVTVVGGPEVGRACQSKIDRLIGEHSDGVENLRRALLANPQADALFLTSDLPFVTGAYLREFVERSTSGALGMAVCAAQSYESRFPGAPAHATHIGGERIANGSVFTIPAGSGPAVVDIAGRFFAARKSLLRMSFLLGPQLLARFAVGRLRIADLERKAAREIRVAVLAVRDCAPELCFDVDTLDDYQYALARS